MQALELQQQRFDDTLAIEREGFRKHTLKRQDSRRLSHDRHLHERKMLQREAADMAEQLRRSHALCRVHDELRSLAQQRVLAAADTCFAQRAQLEQELEATVRSMGIALAAAENEISEARCEVARRPNLTPPTLVAMAAGAAASGAVAAVAVMRAMRSQ